MAIAGAIMAGGSVAAGTSLSVAGYNGLIGAGISAFKSFCEFVGIEVIGDPLNQDEKKEKGISQDEEPNHGETPDINNGKEPQEDRGSSGEGQGSGDDSGSNKGDEE